MILFLTREDSGYENFRIGSSVKTLDIIFKYIQRGTSHSGVDLKLVSLHSFDIRIFIHYIDRM